MFSMPGGLRMAGDLDSGSHASGDRKTNPMLLSENNIKAELSYAYVHAVASRSGCEAVVSGRHRDSAGVDAVISAKDRFTSDSVFTDFSIDVQLKATSGEPAIDHLGRFS